MNDKEIEQIAERHTHNWQTLPEVGDFVTRRLQVKACIKRALEEAASEPSPLTFGDAVKIARGCTDYGGGHHSDGHMEAFQHGIQTVINALEGAEKSGLKDSQIAALWRMGTRPAEQVKVNP